MTVDNAKLAKLLLGNEEDILIARLIIKKHCERENLNWITYYKSLLPPMTSDNRHVWERVFATMFWRRD